MVRFARYLVGILVAVAIAGCSTDKLDMDCSVLTADNSEQCLRLNHIQVLGTHNSYKLDLPDELIQRVNTFIPNWSTNIEYGHRSLTDQLEILGIRQFELDIFADTSGGLFSRPAGALLANDGDFIDRPEMMEPGMKVLHVQDIDYRSTCLTFIRCLEEIRDWSLLNPNHLPITILVELKDSQAASRGDFPLTVPIPFDKELMASVDEEILRVFDRRHIIMPDDVRGSYPTLQEAVLSTGWPTLAESRGRVLFALDNTGRHRNEYLEDTPNLEERVMFVSSHLGEPTAGFVKMNDVIGQFDQIQEFVAAGLIVRTRSDIPTEEARSGDTTRRELSLQSGAQFISTDYPEESPFGSGYIVRLPDAVGPGICNPISAPNGCRNEWIIE